MGVALSAYSFIDDKYYKIMEDVEDIDDKNKVHHIMNFSISFMEDFCNRKLKARDFSYVIGSEDDENTDYDEKYSIFDSKKGTIFYFPTYPVNSISALYISGVEIVAATYYLDTEGYFLYKESGKLVYYDGFDYDYNQNIKIKWNGGYSSTDLHYSELQYIQYNIAKKFIEEDIIDTGLLSESLGNYRYSKATPEEMSETMGLPVFIFKKFNEI